MQPSIESYHNTTINPANCMARRAPVRLQDRRYTKTVNGTEQCKNKPVSGTDLCETCTGHQEVTRAEARVADDWHGRMDGPLPPYSHAAGSDWFHGRTSIAAPVWTGIARPKTAKQEGHLPKAQLVSDTNLRHFADGRIEMDLGHLALIANQVKQLQLHELLTYMHGGVQVGKNWSKQKLVAGILERRELKALAAPAPAVPALVVTEVSALEARVAALEAELHAEKEMKNWLAAKLGRITDAMT